MFNSPKSSKYTLIQQRPTPIHRVAYVTGGLGHLYREIQNNNAILPAKEGDYTDDEGAFAPQPDMPLMASRYRFLRILGKGQSSILVKVQDVFQDGALRSVKVLHTHYSLLGVQESDCVRRINLADPFDTSGTLRLCNTFSYHGHYCMVFELLSPEPMTTYFKELDMHEVIPAIRKVSLRLLQAIGFLQQQNVIHADLKPSNILLKKNADLTTVKVVDFGNAIHCIHDELSLYYDDFELQTLLYRAPEVIYGLTFGLEVDIWSLGCVLAELYLNRPLFCGCDKEETLANMIDFLGPLPEEVFIRGKFFADLSKFASRSSDTAPVTTPELMDKLGCNDYPFVDFLRLLLLYNPHERMTVADAARHPFLAPEIGFGYVMSTSADQSYPSVLLDHQNYTKRPFIDDQRKRQRLSSADLLREGTSVAEPSAPKVKVAHVMPTMKVLGGSGDKAFTYNNNNNNNNIGSYDLEVYDRTGCMLLKQEKPSLGKPRQMSSNAYIRPKITTLQDSRTKVKHPMARYAFSRKVSSDKIQPSARTANYVKVERAERTLDTNTGKSDTSVVSPVHSRPLSHQNGGHLISSKPPNQVHAVSYDPQSSNDMRESSQRSNSENGEAAELEELHIIRITSPSYLSGTIPTVSSVRSTQTTSRTTHPEECHEYQVVRQPTTDALYPESSINSTFIVQPKVESRSCLSSRDQEQVTSSLTKRKHSTADKPQHKRQKRQAEERTPDTQPPKEARKSVQSTTGARRQIAFPESDTDICEVTSTMDNPSTVEQQRPKHVGLSMPNGTNSAVVNSAIVKQHRPKSEQNPRVITATVSRPGHILKKSSNSLSKQQKVPKTRETVARVPLPDNGEEVVGSSNLLQRSDLKSKQRSTVVSNRVPTTDDIIETSSNESTGNSNSVKQYRQKPKQSSTRVSTSNGRKTPIDNSSGMKPKRPQPKAAPVRVSKPNGSDCPKPRDSTSEMVFEHTYEKTVKQRHKAGDNGLRPTDVERVLPAVKAAAKSETTRRKDQGGSNANVENGQHKILKSKLGHDVKIDFPSPNNTDDELDRDWEKLAGTISLNDEVNDTSNWSSLPRQITHVATETERVYKDKRKFHADGLSSSDDEQSSHIQRRIVPMHKGKAREPYRKRASTVKRSPVSKVGATRKRTSTKHYEFDESDPDSEEETLTHNRVVKRRKINSPESQHQQEPITPQNHIRTIGRSRNSSKKKTPRRTPKRDATPTKSYIEQDTDVEDIEDEVMLL